MAKRSARKTARKRKAEKPKMDHMFAQSATFAVIIVLALIIGDMMGGDLLVRMAASVIAGLVLYVAYSRVCCKR